MILVRSFVYSETLKIKMCVQKLHLTLQSVYLNRDHIVSRLGSPQRCPHTDWSADDGTGPRGVTCQAVIPGSLTTGTAQWPANLGSRLGGGQYRTSSPSIHVTDGHHASPHGSTDWLLSSRGITRGFDFTFFFTLKLKKCCCFFY